MKNRRARRETVANGDTAQQFTGVDTWIDKLKRHPITGSVIFLCVVLIALGNTLDAGTKLSDFLATLRRSEPAPAVARINPPAEKVEYVEFDATRPFHGYWSMQFYFVGDTANRADRSRPWFNWGTDLQQTGNAVTGELRTAEHSGKLEGTVEGYQLTGMVQFSWGDEWWESFRLTLDDDGQTANGTAVWVAKNGAHVYEVSARRLPSR